MLRTLKYQCSFLLIACVVLGGCEREPTVFSLENFATRLMDKNSIPGVSLLSTKDLEGKWTGIGHEIIMEFSAENPENILTVEFADSFRTGSHIDTSKFYLAFLKIYGLPFMEVISIGTKPADHDFGIPISTYYKVNRSSGDTLIVQRLNSSAVKVVLDQRSYKYFIPEDEKEDNSAKIYLTEKTARLALLLKELSVQPGNFMESDTLIRIKKN